MGSERCIRDSTGTPLSDDSYAAIIILRVSIALSRSTIGDLLFLTQSKNDSNSSIYLSLGSQDISNFSVSLVFESNILIDDSSPL